MSEAEERVNDAGLREPSSVEPEGRSQDGWVAPHDRPDGCPDVRSLLDVRLPSCWRCIGHMGQGQGALRLFLANAF